MDRCTLALQNDLEVQPKYNGKETSRQNLCGLTWSQSIHRLPLDDARSSGHIANVTNKNTTFNFSNSNGYSDDQRGKITNLLKTCETLKDQHSALWILFFIWRSKEEFFLWIDTTIPQIISASEQIMVQIITDTEKTTIARYLLKNSILIPFPSLRGKLSASSL